MAKVLKVGAAIWRGLEWISAQSGWVAGSLTAVMMIAVMREVVGRYLFNNPSDWSLELSCYLTVALAYLAAGHTLLVEGHIRVDLFYRRFRDKARNFLDIFIYMVALSWSVILVKEGWELAWHSYVKGAHSSESMMWPLFPSQIMVPIGSFLVCLILIGMILRMIRTIAREGR